MILSAGLSPAWQQIMTFDSFVPGEVNRAADVRWCASGKVLNVGRAAWSLGARTHTLCTAGGPAGQAVRSEFAAEGIPATWIDTHRPTRVCTTILDRSAASAACVTELVENAAPITAEELSDFETEYGRLARGADVVVLTGSLPDIEGQEPPIELYRRMLEQSPQAVLDVRGAELQAALPPAPLLVKPNRAELAATVQRILADEDAIVAAMHELVHAGAQWVLITDGPRDALLSNGKQIWRLTPPQRRVVNAIGCGDCLAAGVAVALEDGADMLEAVRLGIAASVENLGQLLPARLALDAARRTAQDVLCRVMS